MSTKKFVARHGLDANFNTISNVADPVNSSDVATKSVTDVIDTKAGLAFDTANTGVSIAQAAFDSSNNVGPQIEPAFTHANAAFAAANSEILLQSGINATQNTNIDNLNSWLSSNNTLQSGINQSQNTYSTAAFTHANAAFASSNTKFSSSGGTISGNVDVTGTLTVEGDFTVSGNVTTISANNVSIQDNMIYLNDGAANNANPDLGIVGAYNDGTYHHTGIFRDATDGYWKVFDNYEPEPDASIYIDTSHASFRVANFRANTFVGDLFSGSGASLTSIPNSALNNSSVTVNGTAISLGGSGTVTAAAGTLTGSTLASGVTASSLTSVGTITSGTWSGSFGAVSGANLTTLNASNLASGTVPDARISGSYTGMTNLTGSGTVDFSKFLGNASDTVSAPSFSWTGDDNTGIYQPAADTVAITTGGTERLRANSTGIYASVAYYGSGTGLTSLPAGQLSGTIPSAVLGNSTLYIGTTSIALNRASASQTLSGVSIDGNAATATNVAWSGITSKPTTVSGYGITNAALSGGSLGNTDFNAQRSLASGIYGVEGTNTNGPAVSAWSHFIQLRERGDTSAQLVIEYSTGRMYSRGIQTATPTYSPWRTQIDDGNYTSYAMPAGASATNSVDVRSPIFYDSNDTGYYIDPNSTTNLNSLTVNGAALCKGAINSTGTYGIKISNGDTWNGVAWGSVNNKTCIIHYGGSSDYALRFGRYANNFGGWEANPFYMYMNDGYATASNSWRSPVFYDSNDTGYYVDPNSTSNMYKVISYQGAKYQTADWADGFRNTPTSGRCFHGDLSSGGPTGTWWFYDSMRHSNAGGYWGTQIAYGWEDNANQLYQRNIQNNSFSGWVKYWNTGHQLQSSIFYDSNDTGYYADPNSTSRFVRINQNANEWNYSHEGWQRLYYQHGDGTIYKGGSTGQWTHIFRNHDDGTRWLMAHGGDFYASGNITAYWSDRRLKKNIEKINDWKNILNNINGYRFQWNDIGKKVMGNDSDNIEVGLIAQEVNDVFPQAAAIQMLQYKDNVNGELIPKDDINYDPENPYLTVREEKLIPVLIEALKSHETEIEQLKDKIEKLENILQYIN